MSKKENIVAVQCFPYIDKYVIVVTRQIDRFHVPTPRHYCASYLETEKVHRLKKLFLTMNSILQDKLVESRIENYQVRNGI